MQVTRQPFSPVGYIYQSQAVENGNTSRSARAREYAVQIPSTWPGFTVTDTTTSPTLSVDLPFLQSVRFVGARNANVNAATNNITHNMFHQLTTQEGTISGTAVVPRIDTYVAAGDDFTLAMFIGAPRMYRLGIGADPPPQE
jgi:hypothetical protein